MRHTKARRLSEASALVGVAGLLGLVLMPLGGLGGLLLPGAAALPIGPAIVHGPVQLVERTFEGDSAGDWIACGFVASAPRARWRGCTDFPRVSTTISGKLAIPAPDISRAVGFDITYSITAGHGFQALLPPGAWGTVAAGLEYARERVVTRRAECDIATAHCTWVYSHNTVQRAISGTATVFLSRRSVPR